MSSSTSATGTYKDLIDPDTYLDERCAAVLLQAGQEGIAGWIFDIPTGEEISLQADITDHYTESGSFNTDHIVLKPLEITLSGLKGELVYTAPKKGSSSDVLSSISTSLTTISGLTGSLTPGATQKLNLIASQAQYAAGQLAAIQKRASNLVKYFSGEDSSSTLQEKAFKDLYSLWKSKQVVTVQTPWAFFGNMAIRSISARQDDQTNDYTDFSITLKEMRFADVNKTTFDSGSYKSAIEAQKSDTNSLGNVQGGAANVSTLDKIFYGGK